MQKMGHKSKCHVLNGQIASYKSCLNIFGFNEVVVKNALNVHLGKIENHFWFGEGHWKPLDYIVCEMEKDISWVDQSNYEKVI
jgi:hypothetical protein